MMNNNVNKAKDFLRLNLFFIVVAAACLIYIARGFINIVETGKTVGEIIADGLVSALFGFFISKLLSLQGIAKGEIDPNVVSTTNLHARTVEKITPKIYLLDEWCERKNEEALLIARSKLLATKRITIDEFNKGIYKTITPNGIAEICENDLDKDKLRAVKRARKLKLTPLSASVLTSDGANVVDPYNFGLDKKGYSIRRDGKQLISKIMCGLLFGYYGVKLINEFNIASLIWTAIQVALFLVMGVIAYLQAYFFMVDEYRHRIIKKIDNLQKFDNEEGLDVVQKLDQVV